jgi:hypothetical protein
LCHTFAAGDLLRDERSASGEGFQFRFYRSLKGFSTLAIPTYLKTSEEATIELFVT